ncbi:unnamed protein product [Brassica oleracea var. botrytis]
MAETSYLIFVFACIHTHTYPFLQANSKHEIWYPLEEKKEQLKVKIFKFFLISQIVYVFSEKNMQFWRKISILIF